MPNYGGTFTKRELLFVLTAILLFFQIYLQKIIGPMQYFDELITVICVFKIILVASKGRLEKSHVNILLMVIFIVIIGLIGNFSSSVQTAAKPIVTDIGNTFKVFVVYIGSSLFLKPIHNKRRMVGLIAKIMRIFVLIVFCCMVLHETGLLNMGNDIRFGIKSFQFVNNGAGQLSMMFYSVILVFTLDLKVNTYNSNRRFIYIILALLVWISTLRSRAFMYVAIYAFLYYMIILKGEHFKFNLKYLTAVLGTMLFLGIDQFETYFSNDLTARSNLMRYGVYTMQRYFPLGSGFATFGTDAAAKYYSKLYYEYGFNNVYGLSKENPMFSHDTYWPAIFAQFGVFGTLLMIALIYRMFRDVIRRAKGNKFNYLAAIFICITQITSSIATATFFNFVTVGVFFLVPLAFDDDM